MHRRRLHIEPSLVFFIEMEMILAYTKRNMPTFLPNSWWWNKGKVQRLRGPKLIYLSDFNMVQYIPQIFSTQMYLWKMDDIYNLEPLTLVSVGCVASPMEAYTLNFLSEVAVSKFHPMPWWLIGLPWVKKGHGRGNGYPLNSLHS